jgi:cbb3-type cytochrome oxidase maturation protein
MGIIIMLVVAALIFAGGFLIAFFWATDDGQFEDTSTPAMRILNEDGTAVKKKKTEPEKG